MVAVFRTNGFGVKFREGSRYSAVYKVLSRINHRYDTHIDLSGPDLTPTRQANLAPYGFQCICAPCSSPTFDDFYRKIHDRVVELSESFNKWLQDRSLPKDHLIMSLMAYVV